MADAKTESKSPLRLDQPSEVVALPPPVSMLAAFAASLSSSASPFDGCSAAGAPGLAVERDHADLVGGLVAASAANEDGAVDEGKLVVFLQEDDEAVRQFDALRLLRA